MMKFFTAFLNMVNPASEGHAYQTMPREKAWQLKDWFALKPRSRWAWRRY